MPGPAGAQRVGSVDLKDAVQRFEIDLISAALERTRGNQSRAARLLGIKHTTLNAKLKRYQIRYSAPSSELSFSPRSGLNLVSNSGFSRSPTVNFLDLRHPTPLFQT
jgi:hypothetical protein